MVVVQAHLQVECGRRGRQGVRDNWHDFASVLIIISDCTQ